MALLHLNHSGYLNELSLREVILVQNLGYHCLHFQSHSFHRAELLSCQLQCYLHLKTVKRLKN